MPKFQIIDNNNYINLPDSIKFNSKDKIVNRNGSYHQENDLTDMYRLISKKELKLEYKKRIINGFIGVLIVVCSFGIAFFFKFIKNLFKVKENIRFGVKYTIDEKELNGDIIINENIISKIKFFFNKITNRQGDDDIKFYNSQYNNRVFELKDVPGLIFKMNYNNAEDRYKKMINAHYVLRINSLALLVLPHAKIFDVNVNGESHKIIAEQKLNIIVNESMQESLFYNSKEKLNDTIKQLALFICKTGYSDVEFRNNPIINNENGIMDEKNKIALLDIEETAGAEIGLFRGFCRSGLIALVDKENNDAIKNIAQENNISIDNFESAVEIQKNKLMNYSDLQIFYKRKNISTGSEEIVVNIESLDLNIEDESKTNYAGTVMLVKLKDVAKAVIIKINELIQKNDKDNSIKGRRFIKLKMSGNLQKYSKFTYEYNGEESWVGKIIHSLVNKNHIFKLIRKVEQTYHIQA